MKVLAEGGITSPQGFLATGKHIGIKAEAKDLAMIASEVPAHAAAVFTTNVVKAAPVVWSQRVISSGEPVRAVVVNSGNANACTGILGMEHAIAMAETVADSLGYQANEVLVASTGVIGVPLPIETVCEGIRQAGQTLERGTSTDKSAAEAIRTTDTFSKSIAVEIELAGQRVILAGMAKGSGMIHPNMATMLSFVTTDADIAPELLEEALRESVMDSYNMISVDGDTSTNDSVFMLANGLAENPRITAKGEAYNQFYAALHYVNTYLAKEIVRDGEGATKFLTVTVAGAATASAARKLAKSVVTSNLVKTAFFGEDANWGRILAAMGYSGADFNPALVNMKFSSYAGTVEVMEGGDPISFDEALAKKVLQERELEISIGLQDGTSRATAWGCDLSYDYVRINGSYRS